LVVGRSRVCDLVISDSEVSRRHLRLSLLQDAPWAIDLGSANGLVVDGISTTRARLGDGSNVWLGGIRLEVRRETASLPPDLLAAWARLGSFPAQALRDLAGAASCTVEPNRSYALQWEPEVGYDDLGPLRKALVDAAVEWISSGHGPTPE
jgi:predicted component of type VI protein secretion system